MRKTAFPFLMFCLLIISLACAFTDNATSTTLPPTALPASPVATNQPFLNVYTGNSNVNVFRMVSGLPDDFGSSGSTTTLPYSEALRAALNAQGFAPIKSEKDVLSSYKEEGSLRVYLVNLPESLPDSSAQRLGDVQGLVSFGDPKSRSISAYAITVYSLHNQPADIHLIAAVRIAPSDNYQTGQIYLLTINPAGDVLGYLQAVYPADTKTELFWGTKGIVVKHQDKVISLTQLAGTTLRPTQPPGDGTASLTILYTDDEHGWMAGKKDGSGAAEMMGLWRALEGYGTDESLLVLSGGDNWTGPAISTWFDGQGMVETMNAMDYDASAVGNHDFDFGLDQLKARIVEAGFPFLSANLRDKTTGNVPTDLGIQPYTLVDVGSLRVGIIGLSTLSTPLTTNPVNLERFKFIDYATALREFVPEMRSSGAELVIVIAHVCPEELTSLAQEVKDLNIPFMGGGHCHNSYSRQTGNTVIQVGGGDMAGYAYTRLSVDVSNEKITIIDYGLRKNTGGDADAEIAAIIHNWQTKTDNELDKEIGYLENEVPEGSREMQALITESWLVGYPNADIAMTNLGGLRDDLPSGNLTLAHIISMLPFDNYLIEVKLTGKQIEKVLHDAGKEPAIGGMKWKGGHWVLNKAGEPLKSDQQYSVLVNDFMYAGGDGYTLFAQYDPDAYNTGIDWRQPVIDWILAQKSSPANPLDEWIKKLSNN
jgi:5'-nucleotidase / UDP-sugar diphosphatase